MAKDSCADKLCNRKGDIIQVEADGHDWEGTCKVCKAPTFQIIKLPKVPVEEARVWLEPLTETITQTEDWLIRPEKVAEFCADKTCEVVEEKKDMTKEEVIAFAEEHAISISDSAVSGDYTVVNVTGQKAEQVRDRKYAISASVVDSITFTGKDVLVVAEKDVSAYKAEITAKILSVEKALVDEEIITK